MTATEWAAWVGACSGLGGLAWNVYLKATSGPRLRLSAFAGMVKMPPPPNNPKFMRITVQNIGTAPTTITNITLHTFPSRWARYRNRATINAVIANYEGQQIPFKLEVGTEWSVLMAHDQRFDDWLGKDTVWCAVWHSFCPKPTKVKIIHPVSAPDQKD